MASKKNHAHLIPEPRRVVAPQPKTAVQATRHRPAEPAKPAHARNLSDFESEMLAAWARD